jgi:hypothetical protein
MKRTYILCAIVVAIAVGLVVSEVRAAGFPAEPLTAPRECNFTDIRIVAGPDAKGEPLAPFPRVVTCPDPDDCPRKDVPLVGQFLLWEFKVTELGKTRVAHVILSVAADIEVLWAYPSAALSDICLGDDTTKAGQHTCESRFIRFDAEPTTTLARYYTPVGLVPTLTTAGWDAGKADGYCPCAGAGTTVFEASQAEPKSQSYVLGETGCIVRFDVAPNGKLIPGSMELVQGKGDCVIEDDTRLIEIDGKPVVYLGMVQWTEEGNSCKYCWTNTYGGKTCVTCTTCCIKKGTTKCIQVKADLSNCDKCKKASKPDICP